MTAQLTEGSFCTGIDGLGIAVRALFGAETRWHCEYDPAPSKVLAHHFPNIPNHGDLTTTDWSAVEPVDIVTAGYPCQPFSTAGKRQGTEDERHLWPSIRDAIRVLRPGIVVLENVRGHLSLGFDEVLADLAGLGFDAEWTTVRSSDIGAPHRRERLFVLAYSDGGPVRSEQVGVRWGGGQVQPGQRHQVAPHASGEGLQGWDFGSGASQQKHGTGECDGDSDECFSVVADADDERQQRPRATRDGREGSQNHDRSTPNTTRGDGGWPKQQSVGEAEGPAELEECDWQSSTEWGRYTGAITRWGRLIRRAAPDPVVNGKRLNPELPEWMMGYPLGWVTSPEIGLTRSQQLKACGNAVQPQAGFEALLRLTRRLGGSYE